MKDEEREKYKELIVYLKAVTISHSPDDKYEEKLISDLASLEAGEEEHEPTYEEISNEHMRLLEEQLQREEKDYCGKCANYNDDSICNKCDDSYCMFEQSQESNQDCANCPANLFYLANTERIMNEQESKEPQGAEEIKEQSFRQFLTSKAYFTWSEIDLIEKLYDEYTEQKHDILHIEYTRDYWQDLEDHEIHDDINEDKRDGTLE